jgi:hypothetical protein
MSIHVFYSSIETKNLQDGILAKEVFFYAERGVYRDSMYQDSNLYRVAQINQLSTGVQAGSKHKKDRMTSLVISIRKEPGSKCPSSCFSATTSYIVHYTHLRP